MSFAANIHMSVASNTLNPPPPQHCGLGASVVTASASVGVQPIFYHIIITVSLQIFLQKSGVQALYWIFFLISYSIWFGSQETGGENYAENCSLLSTPSQLQFSRMLAPSLSAVPHHNVFHCFPSLPKWRPLTQYSLSLTHTSPRMCRHLANVHHGEMFSILWAS